MNQLYDVFILDMPESHTYVINDSEQESISEQPTMLLIQRIWTHLFPILIKQESQVLVTGIQLLEFSMCALIYMKSSITGWSDLAHGEPGFS